jgi:hypothetical protein
MDLRGIIDYSESFVKKIFSFLDSAAAVGPETGAARAGNIGRSVGRARGVFRFRNRAEDDGIF